MAGRMAGDRVVADAVKRIYAGIGSRETPPEVLELMTQLAGRLEQEGWLLRSGGAPGADSAFEVGVRDPRNRAIYLPWPGFQGKQPGGGFFDAQRLPGWQEALATVEQYHPAPDRLSRGGRALMARNAMQVMGPALNRPADLIVAWTPEGRVTGGTGQALRMALDQGIQIRNLGDPAVLESVMSYLSSGTS